MGRNQGVRLVDFSAKIGNRRCSIEIINVSDPLVPLDVAAVAAFAATRLLVMPINLLSSGIGTLMLPLASGWMNAHGASVLHVIKGSDSLILKLLRFQIPPINQKMTP